MTRLIHFFRCSQKSVNSMGAFRSYGNLFLPLACMFILAGGCKNSDENIPDVSNIKVSLQTSRFDKDLYAIDTNHIAEGLQQLAAKYPDFLNYYLDTVMAYGIHGNYSDTTQGVRDGLKVFLTYKDFKGLEDTIQKYYPDSKETDKMLTEGFRFMKYYFPDFHEPRIMYVNMGLSNWASFPIDNTTLCIGLDMFLGDQFPYYKSIGVQDYMAPHIRRSYMPVSVFATIYKTMHPFVDNERTLLDLMIQRGKEQYFLHKILPRIPDSVLFAFTQLQLDWCNKNESVIYNFFIHQKLLYNKDANSIIPYVKDGPFAKDLEPASNPVKVTPGNIGTWAGYRIVCAYMNGHPKVTLAELLSQDTDPAKFLEEARYKPK
jgi:hypothetical protein